jgi:hypothetical protein
MLNFKKVNEMLKGLDVFFSCKIENLSIKHGKVFEMLRRKLMEDMKAI